MLLRVYSHRDPDVDDFEHSDTRSRCHHSYLQRLMCKHCRFRTAGPKKFKEDMAYLRTLLEYKKAGYPFGRDPLKLDRALSLWVAFTQQTTSN